MTPTWNIAPNAPAVWSSPMPDSMKVSGVVLVVGNGGVGKSSLALTMQQDALPPHWADRLAGIRKTKNLEFEFLSDTVAVNDHLYTVVHRYLVPPGQREQEAGVAGRTFEDVIDIYRFQLGRVDVVLLSYAIHQLETFGDIENWVRLLDGLCNDETRFVLVGTHLDLRENREVGATTLGLGAEHVRRLIRTLRPTWRGDCTGIEVSNHSGENIPALRHLISQAILRARGIGPESGPRDRGAGHEPASPSCSSPPFVTGNTW